MGSVPETTPRIRVFIAGGSYAGMSCAMNLFDLAQGKSPRMARGAIYPHRDEMPKLNVDITIADERDGYFHLIGSPLALADAKYSEKAWVRYSDVPALQPENVPAGSSIRVVQGSVSSIDPEAKVATVTSTASDAGEKSTYPYDFFVAATGLRRVWPVVPQSTSRKAYLAEAAAHIDAVSRGRHGVVVVGGGAVGIEMAAELKLVMPHVDVTLAHSRNKLLSSEGLSDECKDKALELLREGGVTCLMEHRLASDNVVTEEDGQVRHDIEFTNGHKMSAGVVIMAISRSVPTTTYLPEAARDHEGFIPVSNDLRLPSAIPNYEHHYCGGDAIRWMGVKRCGGAMHHGHYIACNIHQTVLAQTIPGFQPDLRQLTPVEPMIGLAVGKQAVASGPDGTIFGEEVAQSYFRDDLGFDICWNWIGLGGETKA